MQSFFGSIKGVPDGIFICASSGKAGEGDAVKVISAMMAHPQWKPGMPRCYDISRLDAGSLTIKEMRRIASFAAINKNELGGGKIAMVTSRDLEYGFSRMLSVLISPFGKTELVHFFIKLPTKSAKNTAMKKLTQTTRRNAPGVSIWRH